MVHCSNDHHRSWRAGERPSEKKKNTPFPTLAVRV
jgi:hypothetical protein